MYFWTSCAWGVQVAVPLGAGGSLTTIAAVPVGADCVCGRCTQTFLHGEGTPSENVVAMFSVTSDFGPFAQLTCW
jgi:hypothetical protein